MERIDLSKIRREPLGELSEYYSEAVLRRVEQVLYEQIRKYAACLR